MSTTHTSWVPRVLGDTFVLLLAWLVLHLGGRAFFELGAATAWPDERWLVFLSIVEGHSKALRVGLDLRLFWLLGAFVIVLFAASRRDFSLKSLSAGLTALCLAAALAVAMLYVRAYAEDGAYLISRWLGLSGVSAMLLAVGLALVALKGAQRLSSAAGPERSARNTEP